MNKALIMGITGNFGGNLAHALLERGWSIRALMRDAGKLPQPFQSIEVVEGDAGCDADVKKAAQGVDLIVYGVNPNYMQWDDTVLPWLENVARVAEQNATTVVFPGNVYIFSPQDGPEYNEQSKANPLTLKGKLRQRMEARLELAAQRGARVIVVRAGDFIASGSKSAWLPALIKRTKSGYVLNAASHPSMPHTWAYLPDLAHTIAALVDRRNELAPYSVFHYKGYQVNFNQIAEAMREASGKPVRVKNFNWWMLRLLKPFSAMFRSLLQMRYLWNYPIHLSDAKLVSLLGKARHTPLAQALLDSGLVSREVPKSSAMR